MWLKNHRRLTNLFLLDHVSIESSQSSHFPRSQFVVLVFGLYFCTRVVVYLRFRFVFSLLGLVACLRCSVCHVPSLLGLSRAFVSSRRVPLFSASAFVLGFGIRSRLRHSFSAFAFVTSSCLRSRYGLWGLVLCWFCDPQEASAPWVPPSCFWCTHRMLSGFLQSRSRCCSLLRRWVSLLLFRNARSRCCPFVSLGLAAPHRRRHSNLSLKLGGCASSPPPLVRGIHSFVIWGATFSS